MKYPPPSHAASIWLADQTIFLGLPGITDHEHGHTVQAQVNMAVLRNLCADTDRFDLNERKTFQALASIINTLHERATQTKQTIGMKGAPTQWDLDIVMKALAKGAVTVIKPKVDAKKIDSLEDLGL
jgi:hypothetical protein